VQLFAPLYRRAMDLSRHPHAPRYLGLLSFVEAFVFPVPPEVMLAPMTLARPRAWFRYATISLVFALLGGLVGYAIGAFAIDLVLPVLDRLGYRARFEEVRTLATDHGFWLLLVGGFTPIPLKLFTLASGAVHMPLLPFLAGLFIGRAKRVYLVTGAVRLGGERAEQALHRHVEKLGWAAMVLLLFLLAWFWWSHPA